MAEYASSNYLENAILNATLRGINMTFTGSGWVGLYTTNPTDENTGTEVSGGSYERQEATFYYSMLSNTFNGNDITFPTATAPWGTINYVGVSNASASGSLLYYCKSNNAVTIGVGEAVYITSGNLYIVMKGNYSRYLGNKIINSLFWKPEADYTSPGSSVYLALYSDYPTAVTGGTELTAADYARLLVGNSASWITPISGSTYNVVDFTFTTDALSDWGDIKGLGIYDDPTGGNLLYYGNLSASKVVNTGDGFEFPAGELTIELS